jgi:hypothetical protein
MSTPLKLVVGVVIALCLSAVGYRVYRVAFRTPEGRLDLADRSGWKYRKTHNNGFMLVRDDSDATLVAVPTTFEPDADDLRGLWQNEDAGGVAQTTAAEKSRFEVWIGEGSPRPLTVDGTHGLERSIPCPDGTWLIVIYFADADDVAAGEPVLRNARCLAPDAPDVQWPQ